MRRVILLVAVLSMFMHVGVANASGPVGSVPPPQYPNWGCTGTCNSSNGDWSLTAGSSMVTNVASLYTNENVVIDVNDLVVPNNACIDITVDTLHICTSSNGLYPWTFSNVSGSYHQIQIFCSTSCQGNYLVSVLPISAPSPSPTPNPSFTATPTPVVPPTVTPPSVPRITHTPTVSPTPCVVNAWGCDQPATATYVACESGIVVNYGADPCLSTPTPGATSTPTATPSGGPYFNCGDPTFPLLNCSMVASSATGANQYYPTYVSSGWQVSNNRYVNWASKCSAWSACTGINAAHPNSIFLVDSDSAVQQEVTANVTGALHVSFYDRSPEVGGGLNNACVGVGLVQTEVPVCTRTLSGSDTVLTDLTVTTVTAGTSYWFRLHSDVSTGTGGAVLELVSVWVVPDSGTPYVTVGPTSSPTVNRTASPLPTWTPRPTFTSTPFASPTITPIGYVAPTATILANIDTCLGTIQDCNLALTPIAGKIGGIPGLIATPMAPLNTSVFSPFQTIGITRGGCLSFGKLPVMIPHIQWLASPVPVRGGPTSTPDISGYVPISVTWTLPTVVGTPMRQGNFGPIDPMEFEPCNDPAVPTWAWDLSWNASTFFEWIGFFVWTIALIRRIFG